MTVNKFQISHIFLSMSCFFWKKKKEIKVAVGCDIWSHSLSSNI